MNDDQDLYIGQYIPTLAKTQQQMIPGRDFERPHALHKYSQIFVSILYAISDDNKYQHLLV